MEMFADIAIGVGALLAAAYCMLLSRRLRNFTRLDGDVGRAIALLSTQVDQLTRALSAAEAGSAAREQTLREQISAAEQAARRLELLMAADRPEARAHMQEHASAVAPDGFWNTKAPDFHPSEAKRAPEARLRTTRSRMGGNV